MGDGLLPRAIADERFAVLDEMVQERLAALPVAAVFVYVISAVHESVLPALAWQFSALGPTYQAAPDDASRRAIIERTLIRRRQRGTHFAVHDALDAAGVNNLVKDAQPIRYNGQFRHRGDVRHSPPPEHVFWVVVVGEPSPSAASAIVAIVKEWQRRSMRFEVFWVETEELFEETTEYHAVA